jgi:hypothetical protein
MKFEVGYINDLDGRTHDITIILKHNDPESTNTAPYELVDYYFGSYDPDTTNTYIDKWLTKNNGEIGRLTIARDCLNDYCLINGEDMDEYDYRTMMSAKNYINDMIVARESLIESDNLKLTQLKKFKEWFDSLIGPDATEESIEQLYETSITITVAGKSIDLCFDAENYNNVDTVLKRAIEEF